VSSCCDARAVARVLALLKRLLPQHSENCCLSGGSCPQSKVSGHTGAASQRWVSSSGVGAQGPAAALLLPLLMLPVIGILRHWKVGNCRQGLVFSLLY
jgi:hypothetical protein